MSDGLLLPVLAAAATPRRRRPGNRGGARGFFTLNTPGQDVKGGRRLLPRPLRYRAIRSYLQRGRYDVGTLQECTTEARRAFGSHRRWGVWAGSHTNEKSGVGNAVVWRSDRLEVVDRGTIELPWAGATRGALYLPWVRLRPKGGGRSFVALAGHLPYVGYPKGSRNAATVVTRARMIVRVALFLRGTDGGARDWFTGMDFNSRTAAGSLARRARGRVAAQHNVDGLVTSKGFKVKAARAVSQGVMWKFGDHPLVVVRGGWD